jgi:cell division protease FtsH
LQILQVHTQKVRLADHVDLLGIARTTSGFSGAELANLVNEAALLAARQGKEAITLTDFEAAKDRIMMGAERKGLVISDEDRRTMAYHEAGHAILAKFLPHADPLHKITIIPRGRAMGHTQQLPLGDRHAYSEEYLRSRITILMGGRAAEKIALNQQTTGAQEDLLRATEIATRMVCKWGMNEAAGPLAYAKDEEGFLGEETHRLHYSEATAHLVDREIKKLIDGCYREADRVLTEQKKFLFHLAEILLDTETLDGEEMDIIFECSLAKQKEEDNAAGPETEAVACR